MVQDQFDPEYFLGIYETIDKSSGYKVRQRLKSVLTIIACLAALNLAKGK